MRNFQNIVFIRTQTYGEIFKSAYGEIFKSSVPLKATQNLSARIFRSSFYFSMLVKNLKFWQVVSLIVNLADDSNQLLKISFSSVHKSYNQERNKTSRPEVLYEKSVLRNFLKFTGKHLFQNLLFNKRRFWHSLHLY